MVTWFLCVGSTLCVSVCDSAGLAGPVLRQQCFGAMCGGDRRLKLRSDDDVGQELHRLSTLWN